jgi:hypothetical protein
VPITRSPAISRTAPRSDRRRRRPLRSGPSADAEPLEAPGSDSFTGSGSGGGHRAGSIGRPGAHRRRMCQPEPNSAALEVVARLSQASGSRARTPARGPHDVLSSPRKQAAPGGIAGCRRGRSRRRAGGRLRVPLFDEGSGLCAALRSSGALLLPRGCDSGVGRRATFAESAASPWKRHSARWPRGHASLCPFPCGSDRAGVFRRPLAGGCARITECVGMLRCEEPFPRSGGALARPVIGALVPTSGGE